MKVFTKTARLFNVKRLFIKLSLLMAIVLSTSISQAQTQLAAWTFDATAAAPSTPATVTANLGSQNGTATLYANGTNGSSTWITATTGNELTTFGGSTLNDPRGTAVAGQAYVPVGGTGFSANGKHMVFKYSMTGFQDPVLTYATRGTSTGFTTHTWAWSTDGTSFTNFQTITGRTATSFSLQTVNLSAINDVDNATDVYLRVTFTGATNATGNNRLDNIVINADTYVPATPPTVTPDNLFGNVGSAFNYQVQATNSPTSYGLVGTLPAGLSFSSLTGVISGTPTAAESQTVSVTATNGNGTSDPADITIQVDPGNQTITFGPLADVTYGDADFSLSATASSGLPITYFSSNPFVATVSGNTVTIMGAGTTTITATQEGDVNYNAAPDVPQNLTVNKASQTITFGPLADKSTADADFTLTATASSGLPVSYSSSDLGVATITPPNTLHIVGAGNTTITASQDGDDNYLPATPVDQNQFISNASLQNQSITFPAIPNAVYGDAPVAPGATASSGLTVTYSSDNNDVATVSGSTLVITGVGTATITASQAGNGTYNPAPDETQTITVTEKELTVTGVTANDKIYDGNTDATLNLGGASLVGVVGADDVSFSTTGALFTDANVGTGIPVNTNLVLSGVDAANYTLTQPSVTASITPAPQTITFNPLPAATTNTAPIDLTTYASVNSPNALTFTSSDDLVASVSGNTLTINGPGTATITASQAGGGNYAAATPVDQSITVTLAPSVVTWNFGTTVGAPFPSSGLPVNNLDVSAFQAGNDRNSANNGTLQFYTNSTSPTPAFSGLYNVGLTAYNSDFNPMSSAYFQFTITPDAGYQVTLNDLSFGSRSTSSGPTTLSIRTSADGFVNDIATLSPAANGNWSLYEPTFTPITTSSPLTVRIYGYVTGGAGTVTTTGSANWRMDDVTFEALVQAQAPCTGTPEAGSITANETNFCGSGITDITATGFTDPGTTPGISLQWYSSTNNVDFTPVDGATTATLVTGVLSQTTYYYLQVSCSGSGLSAVSNTATITVNPVPATPTISGSSVVCTGNTTLLTASAAPAGSTYNWFNNGNPLAETTQSVTVGAGSYTVSVTSEGCTGGLSSVFEVNELGAPSAPFVEGPRNVCQYVGTGDQVVYTVFPDPNVSTYNWVVPPTVNIISGQGTGSITVTFSAAFLNAANKQIRVTGTAACGTTPMTIKYLVAQIPSTPGAITGPTDVCDLIGTAATAVYSVPEIQGATDYNWTLPAGVNVVNDNGNSIEVSFTNAFVSSVFTVSSGNLCGVSGLRSLTVNRVSPSTPGLITGSTNACMFMPTASNPTGTPTTFSVARSANVTTYNWTVPAGANIINHTQTATEDIITVEFTGAYTSGAVSVSAANNCGTSASRTLTLTNLNPGTPSAIDVVNTQSCPNRMFTYSLTGTPSNTTDLVWTVPVGGTIVSGQGTASIQVSYADGAIAGNVTVTGSNGCATSATRSVSVKLAACPPAPKQALKATPAITGVEVEVLDAGIFPNPSVSDFRLKVKTSAKERIQVRVFDANGTAHAKMMVMPGETISFGQYLKAGTYFVEVMQGKERKVSKIVKL